MDFKQLNKCLVKRVLARLALHFCQSYSLTFIESLYGLLFFATRSVDQ